mmetsp:Transcript_36766/g.54014  ORF Transcript_36766/g.54014 Transcript_36766/m.54014 type:complete len:390 (-) Transcript_36766:127-1296(-)|eukprot:CAMPEP_0195512732 /NCGR_PEP_ID=MMETSP0794_2-20130614/4594_1 /TAXON_ID=515487 /ORGANISM="Stephanopyxis turris, Strain CCMP 815" /LENGTH=389 /DNA_ID=CAMNT_0040640589 /DNA_START=58 /DNA_END=1227 /DNA_ORIENTATION=+
MAANGSERPIQVTKKNTPVIFLEAKKRVDEMSCRSMIFDERLENEIPRFWGSELELGRVLGRGGFCVVKEIKNVDIQGLGVENRSEKEEERRLFIKSHVTRNKDARYAVKTLSDECQNDAGLYLKGVVDLAIEARFLAVIENPHIIKMRAVACCSSFEHGFFVVLDRLYDTLEHRFAKWRTKSKKIINALPGASKKRKKSLLERTMVAYDLCCAMLHLHKHNIIYRDLKPENIGFDVRDDVKIFDFGLAKELHPEDKLADGTYKLTGVTGSLRYMAPEVATWKNYNLTADVYSYSILLWSILSAEIPFKTYTTTMHADFVVKKGYRPQLEKKKWSLATVLLLQRGWAMDLNHRPNFEEVADVLREEVTSLRGDGDVLDLDQTRRSKHSN